MGGSPLFAMQLAVHESTAWNLAASTARRLSPPISMKVNFHSVCASVATRCRFPCALYAQSYILTGTAGSGHYHQARAVGLSASLASTIILFQPIIQYVKVRFAFRLGAWGGVAPVVWLKVLPLPCGSPGCYDTVMKPLIHTALVAFLLLYSLPRTSLCLAPRRRQRYVFPLGIVQ